VAGDIERDVERGDAENRAIGKRRMIPILLSLLCPVKVDKFPPILPGFFG
jgi:hypothetical protein